MNVPHWKKFALAVVVALALLQVRDLYVFAREARVLYAYLKLSYLQQQQRQAQQAAQQKQQQAAPAPIPAAPVN